MLGRHSAPPDPMATRQGRTARAAFFALLSAVLMIAHQVGGKATRDAIFLSQFEVTQLPRILIVAATLSMLAVIVMSRLLSRYGPHRIVPGAFLASAALFVVNWILHGHYPQPAALALYLQMAVFGAVLISGFWSVVNERFDPHTAKRTIAQVAAAATLGGVIGGFMADRIAVLLDARAMIAVLGGLHVACAGTVLAIGVPRGRGSGRHIEVASGIAELFSNRYLASMGLLMVLVAAMAALIDYAFKAQVSGAITDEAALVSLFGRFYAITGVVTFIVQWALGPRLLHRAGLGATLAVLPLVVIASGVMNIVALRLWSVVAMRGGQMVMQNSFYRSAFELLYTPVPPARKRPTKSIIDVASDRLGDVVGGGIVLAMLALVPEGGVQGILALAMLLALVTLLIVRRLDRGYVAQLADNLRDGHLSIDDDEVVDATTRQILAESSASSERALLAARIRERRRKAPLLREHPDTIEPPVGPGEQLAASVEALTSGEPRRVRAVLEGPFMDTRLVPFIVPMLAVDEVSELARTELRFVVPQCVGMLTDALLDPDVPLLARQRLPSVLEVSPQPRVIDALLTGLGDEPFNVRYASARALSRMQDRDATLPIDAARVFAACEREVAVPQEIWAAHDIRADETIQGEDPVATDSGFDVNYSLEHVFTLLSLVLDRDALRLSFKAVFSSERTIRGTALEYLENVLPEAIRRGLWPHLGEREPAPGAARGAPAVLAELRDKAQGTRPT